MKRGFTLLELIIVIIIIGLLAAVGMNQYVKAIANAKNAQAKAILSEMRKAAQAYNSKNGTWPPAGTSLNVDLDGDNNDDVMFTAPSSNDFTFTTRSADGFGKASKSGTAGSGVYSWTIDYSTGVLTSS